MLSRLGQGPPRGFCRTSTVNSSRLDKKSSIGLATGDCGGTREGQEERPTEHLGGWRPVLAQDFRRIAASAPPHRPLPRRKTEGSKPIVSPSAAGPVDVHAVRRTQPAQAEAWPLSPSTASPTRQQARTPLNTRGGRLAPGTGNRPGTPRA